MPRRSGGLARLLRMRIAGRFRWLILPAVFCVLAGLGLATGLVGKPAPSSPGALQTPAHESPALSVAGTVLGMPSGHIPDRAPLLPARPGLAERAHAGPSAGRASAAPSSPAQHTPSPAPASTPRPAFSPTPTAENQTPTGSNELVWSEAILTALGDPLTDANITSLGYWMQNEAGSPPSGIVGANNPINVSQPGYGGWPIKREGKGYSLYSYPDPQDGIKATVTFLIPTVYPRILAALKAGAGLSSSSLASELSVYSGGGYTEIPDAWGASQGRPET